MSGTIVRTVSRARRFGRLSRIERSVFLSSLVAMFIARAALILMPMRCIMTGSAWLASRFPLHSPAPLDAGRAARRIIQAARFCPMTTCLSQAIAARFVMTRLGHDSEVRIGVAKAGEKFEAHAWLECADHTIVGNPSPEGKMYAPLPSLRRFVA